MKRKHLSSIANDVLQRSAEILNTYIEGIVEEFEVGWKSETNGYSRKLVEFCSLKALVNICSNIEEKIEDGSFNQFTFDMMLDGERPSSADDESYLVYILSCSV
ncbi:uncharacterized protein LOC122087169 [Macadamia integrifolia]|uniref:uncharacterized protein LOC122087169 n=1 Tax=Macadamia integrifolia TaxID=60698 RepID=UPI001C4EDF81|nr:uncharacterized protein LOC122087169 [Macadamia integrifolia]